MRGERVGGEGEGEGVRGQGVRGRKGSGLGCPPAGVRGEKGRPPAIRVLSRASPPALFAHLLSQREEAFVKHGENSPPSAAQTAGLCDGPCRQESACNEQPLECLLGGRRVRQRNLPSTGKEISARGPRRRPRALWGLSLRVAPGWRPGGGLWKAGRVL